MQDTKKKETREEKMKRRNLKRAMKRIKVPPPFPPLSFYAAKASWRSRQASGEAFGATGVWASKMMEE